MTTSTYAPDRLLPQRDIINLQCAIDELRQVHSRLVDLHSRLEAHPLYKIDAGLVSSNIQVSVNLLDWIRNQDRLIRKRINQPFGCSSYRNAVGQPQTSPLHE